MLKQHVLKENILITNVRVDRVFVFVYLLCGVGVCVAVLFQFAFSKFDLCGSQLVVCCIGLLCLFCCVPLFVLVNTCAPFFIKPRG